MTLGATMRQHPSSIDNYIRHGWKLVPIPFGSKGPMTKNWNDEEKCLKSANDLPPNWGIGLAHAYSGTMALDIDAWDYAHKELEKQSINLTDLYNAPDAVVIDSGREGHGKLLYKMPFGMTLPSKKLITTVNGQKFNYLDFRCSTANNMTVQDVLPPSIHPDTMKPYQWAGKGSWDDLPTIPDDLLAFWYSHVEEDDVKDISDQHITTSWSEIQSVLHHISPECDRDQWVKIGMALHHAGHSTKELDIAFMIWDDWSSQSDTKYQGQKDLMRSWRSFRPDSGVTIGTLFHIAKEHGYERPTPSAADLFSAIHKEEDAPISFKDILVGYKPIIPQPDMDLLPQILKDQVSDVYETVGCDPIIPLLAGIACASGAANHQSRLKMAPGYYLPPILWVMTIGRPAGKKSPGSKPMLEIIKILEKEDHQRYNRAKLEFEAIEVMYEVAHKAYLDHFKNNPDAIIGNADVPQVADEPPKPPIPLRIVVTDITSQELVRKASDRPEGLLCHLDEMNGWIKKVNSSHTQEDRSTWTLAYEASPHYVDRVGGGAIYCDNFGISIFGNVQPDVFRKTFKVMGEDGLLQRFIPGVIDTNRTKVGNPVEEEMTHQEQWNTTIRLIHSLPKQEYTLSPGAYEHFRAFQYWYHDAVQDFTRLNFSNTFMTSFGKIEGTLGRLMFIFHLLEDPFSTSVSESIAERSIKLIKDYFIPTYRFAYDNIVGDGDENNLELWLFEYVLYHCKWETEVTTTTIRKAARRQIPESLSRFEKNERISMAMLALEEAKWAVRVEDYNSRGIIKWVINPKLYSMFKADRNENIEKRQKWKDFSHEKAGITKQKIKK